MELPERKKTAGALKSFYLEQLSACFSASPAGYGLFGIDESVFLDILQHLVAEFPGQIPGHGKVHIQVVAAVPWQLRRGSPL